MSPMLGLRFIGSFRGKAAGSKNTVAASEELQERESPASNQKASTSNECRSNTFDISERTLFKEVSLQDRTRSSSSKDNGAARSKETRKKSESPDETRPSLAGKMPADSRQTNSHRSKRTSRKQTEGVRSDDGGSIKNTEFLGEPNFLQRGKPPTTKARSSNRRTKKKSSKKWVDEKIWLNDGAVSSVPTRVTKKNFEQISTPRPDEIFTNHESIPSMSAVYNQFTQTYPEYQQTVLVDQIRSQEYPHLDESGHVCLDYSGYGLFSQAQQTRDKASSSFGLSYISANLPTHALYGGADIGTAEFDIKCRICDFLNVQESEYSMVFTASRGSAFRLLAESYPFHLKKRLLTVYDSESDAVKWIEDTARKKGAEVLCANFRWPSQRLWATDLKKKIQEKKKTTKKKGSAKGLFVFPMQSRVTGTRYSYQWLPQAQENGWEVLLDASALGANVMDSFGLSVFRPEFIVSSFFKVYGTDPTGFGCLLIKRSSIQGLHSSSAARGVGMVRLVPLTAESSSPRVWEACMKDSPIDQEKHIGEIEILDEKEDKFECVAWSIHAGQRKINPVLSFSHSKTDFHTAVGTSNKPSISALAAFEPERGSEAELESNSPGSETCGPVYHQQESEIEPAFYAGNPPSTIPAHIASSSEPLQEQSDVIFLNGIVNDSASDDFELTGAASDGEKGASDSESGFGRTYEPQECSTNYGNIAAQGRASFCSASLEEAEGVSYRNYGRKTSASAYYMDSPGDHRFLYSEDALSVFPDEVEEYDDDDYDDDDDNANFCPDVAYDVSVMERKEPEIICRGLDHVDKLGLIKSNNRFRFLINWLVGSMLKLHHPGSGETHRLVQIYGPKIGYDRGASVAFNLFDWRGDLLQPKLVQRLADRSNISLGTTYLHHIRFPDNYLGFLEPNRGNNVRMPTVKGQPEGGKFSSIEVITANLGFITNFEDVYRLWAFLAKFLDADFVSKELWRYRSLNQETVLLGMHESVGSPL